MLRRVLQVLILAFAVHALAGCGSSPGGSSSVLASIVLTAPQPSVPVGGTDQITALAKDNNGNAMSGVVFSWSSGTTSVATVDPASGLASALLPGTTQITASANGITSAPVTLSVTPGFLNIETLNTARASTTITMLNTGQVLIAAGMNTGGVVNSAELFNPTTNTFSFTGSLAAPRYDHTATLLDNGKVLVVGGSNAIGVLGSAELYDPASGTFAMTGSLTTARVFHTATHLQNGQVLIAGGSNGTTADYASAELYDPTTGVFTSTGNLNFARRLATATLLNDGTVLIAGGIDSTGVALASAEIYDPATGTFNVTGSLTTARGFHTASLLNGGGVLISGGAMLTGTTFVPFASAELYDPATRSFTATGSLKTARANPSATLLNNGTVLVAGGTTPGSPNTVVLTSAEIYDPDSGTFATTGSLNVPHSNQASALLPNGSVLIAGNFDLPGTKAPAELYEPATFTPPGLQSIAVAPGGTIVSSGAYQAYVATGAFASGTQQLRSIMWTSSSTATAEVSNDASNLGAGVAVGSPIITTPVTITATAGNISGSATLTVRPPGFANAGNMTIPRIDFVATLLNNGKVLLSGGASSNAIVASAELYDPSSGSFGSTGSMNEARFFHTATLLKNGKVLIAGGFGAGTLATAELYDPVSQTFALTGSMATARIYATATLLPNGQVLVAGGTGSDGSYLSSAELYDPDTGSFMTTGPLQVGRSGHVAVLLENGEVLFAGGFGTIGSVTQVLSSAELYDPVAGTFALSGNMNAARFDFTGTLLKGGTILMAGGIPGPNTVSSAEVYDPSSGEFSLTGNMTSFRQNHSATLLTNGLVLIAGGQGNSSPALSSAELYDPSTGTFTATTSLNTPRLSFTATRLWSGMVLLAGGGDANGNVLSSTELY